MADMDAVSDETLQTIRFARNAYRSAVADWESSGQPKTGRAAYNLRQTRTEFLALMVEHGPALVEEVLVGRNAGATQVIRGHA